MISERWEAIGKGTDQKTGQPIVYVAREKTDHESRLTIWKLMQREGVWRSIGQFLSTGVFRTFPERNGVRLTDSKTDQTLFYYAEETVNG